MTLHRHLDRRGRSSYQRGALSQQFFRLLETSGQRRRLVAVISLTLRAAQDRVPRTFALRHDRKVHAGYPADVESAQTLPKASKEALVDRPSKPRAFQEQQLETCRRSDCFWSRPI